MKIFKQKKTETSNDYYEAYKAELGGTVEKNKFFSFSNILKLEIIVIAFGLFIMNQNDLSLELKKMYVAENNVLPVSMQTESLDSDLVVQLEDVSLEKITIREDISTNKLEKETYVENADIKLLIQLLEYEMQEKQESVVANRIVLSQK